MGGINLATVFRDEQQVYECIGEFIRQVSKDEVVGPNIKCCGLIIKYQFTNPPCEITIDARNLCRENAYFNVYCGESCLQPDVILIMEADIAHRFWCGSLDLITALTRRQIIARGPVHKVMRMLPSIRPVHSIYREHLKKIDFQELNQQMA